MTIYYLYVKTHTVTGLKYLGQTSKKDPHKYAGSGRYWKEHLRMFGERYTTEIIASSSDKSVIDDFGRYYSELWRITSSVDDYGTRIWANLIPETGGGPGWKHGIENPSKSMDFRQRKKISQLGSANPKFDPTLYVFRNNHTGLQVTMTKFEFRTKFNLAHSHVSNLVSGRHRVKSVRGWIFIGKSVLSTSLPD